MYCGHPQPFRFLALMIRVRMQTVVSKSGLKDLTVDNVLFAAATYKVIGGGLRVHTEKTKLVREMLDLFGVKDPEQLPLPGQT